MRFNLARVRAILLAPLRSCLPLRLSNMPAQPLSRVFPNARIIIGGDAASKQPEIAVQIARAIAHWAQVELALGELFVAILGANSIPAIAMYTALTSSAAQFAALKAAAEAALCDEDKFIFQAITSLHKAPAKERNRFAHWVWAFSPDVENSIILCDPASIIRYSADNFGVNQGIPSWFVSNILSQEKDLRMFGSYLPDRSKMFVYRLKDIEEILGRIIHLSSIYDDFHSMLLPQNGVRDKLRQSLLDDPEIAKVISRIRAGQNASA